MIMVFESTHKRALLIAELRGLEIERLQKESDAQYEAEGKMLAEVTELYAEIERLKADAAPAFYKLGNGEWTTLAPSERGDK
jgi:hypothetical protein